MNPSTPKRTSKPPAPSYQGQVVGGVKVGGDPNHVVERQQRETTSTCSSIRRQRFGVPRQLDQRRTAAGQTLDLGQITRTVHVDAGLGPV